MICDLRHLKERCAACELTGKPMNKEHVFPKWLILRTGTNRTGIRWGDRRDISALAATFPLCESCNSELGRELESPVKKLFDEIEARQGLSDNDAELFIRWMWKIKGLGWLASHPNGKYTDAYTLRERVLCPIDHIRGSLVLAVALFDKLHPESNDYPMGIDSFTNCDAIFVSGVFSQIAAMVVLDVLAPLVPQQFTLYRLFPRRLPSGDAKIFHPAVAFEDDIEAVGITWRASQKLTRRHDELARQREQIRQK